MTAQSLTLLAALPIGFLIGLVGIGGVLLVPMLAELGGYSQHDAVGLSLASFIALGFAGVWMRVRARTAFVAGEWRLYATMIPGAIAGAFALSYIPETLLRFIVAIAVACTGLWALFCGRTSVEPAAPPSASRLAAYGVVTGGASALTGTGGPLVLMPLLLALGIAAQDALGMSKAAQLPIALSATITRGMVNAIDLRFAALLSVVLLAGMFSGSRVAAGTGATNLKTIIGWAMTCTGVGLCVVDAYRTWGS